jgi:hypothetical protein
MIRGNLVWWTLRSSFRNGLLIDVGPTSPLGDHSLDQVGNLSFGEDLGGLTLISESPNASTGCVDIACSDEIVASPAYLVVESRRAAWEPVFQDFVVKPQVFGYGCLGLSCTRRPSQPLEDSQERIDIASKL